MAKPTRSDDWGFPRWRPYGAKGRAAARVRLCDREGCNEVGDRPAPKAPNSPERWMFCEDACRRIQQELELLRRPDRRRGRAPRSRRGKRRFGLSQQRPLCLGRAGRRKPQPRRDAGAGYARAGIRRRFQVGEGRLSPPRQGASPRPAQGRQGSGQAISMPSRRPMRCCASRRSERPGRSSRASPQGFSMKVPAAWAIGFSGSPPCASPRTKATWRVSL